DQGLLAPQSVTDVPEDDATERAGQEAHPERRERDESAEPAFDLGEENLVEHQRGGGAEDVEVEPFDGAADESTNPGTIGRSRLSSCVRRTHVRSSPRADAGSRRPRFPGAELLGTSSISRNGLVRE